jgi:hypothetical protein
LLIHKSTATIFHQEKTTRDNDFFISIDLIRRISAPSTISISTSSTNAAAPSHWCANGVTSFRMPPFVAITAAHYQWSIIETTEAATTALFIVGIPAAPKL